VTPASARGWQPALLAMLLCLGGCYSVASVPASSLRALRSSRGGVVALDTTSGQRTVLTPRSRIRFQRIDGTYTRAVSASDLAVNDEGLFAIHAVRVDEATEAIGCGLDDAALEVLARTAPEGRTPEVSPDGSVRLRGTDGAIYRWLSTFMFEMATYRRPLGRWTFRCPEHGWAARGWTDLITALDHGIEVTSGLAWRDLHRAEIENMNGGRTVGALVAGTALAGPVFAAVVAQNLGFTLPSTPDLPVSASDLEAASPWVGGPRWSEPGPMMWSAGWKAPQIEHRRRVFTRWTRIRSISDPVLTMEGGHDLRFGDDKVFNGSYGAVVRFIGLIDVGAGARYTISRDGYDTVGGYFRLGGHFHLDMQGRFAGAFGTDLGAGRSFQFRPFLGLRARLTEQLFLGVFPFNPLYTGSGLGVRGRSPGWTFPSTLEVSFAF